MRARRRESDLCPPVKRWLVDRGYTVHCEIFDADMVGIQDETLCVVELKLCASRTLLYQCFVRCEWADWVWIAVPSRPRDMKRWRSHGIGVLVVADGKVRQIAKAKPQPRDWHKKHAYRVKRMTALPPAAADELGGVATRQ